MDTIVTALKETPIPTILVVAGIVFLLLSIAGQLAGRVTVPPERQRQATIIGCLLVVVGIALHVIPSRLIPPAPPRVSAPTPSPSPPTGDQPPQTTSTPPNFQPPPSTPQPPTQDFKVVSIPSLNARLTALRFFEGTPCNEPSLEERTYRQRFAKVMTRDIYTEFTLEHPKHDRQVKITIQGFYHHQGKETSRPEVETFIPANKEKSVFWFHPRTGPRSVISCINVRRGDWSVGSYTVDVYIEGEQVTNGSFEIYE